VAWQWLCRLWVWEEDLLGDCRILLHDISLQYNSTYMWLWRIDSIDGYSVRGVYHMLTNHEPAISDATTNFIWHKQLPLKVLILVWRLFRNRFLTKDNLLVRDILSHDNQLCVTGWRLLNICFCLAPVLLLYRALLGLSLDFVTLTVLFTEHVVQFVYLSGGFRASRSFLQLVWLYCIWVLWNERNCGIFKNIETPIHQ